MKLDQTHDPARRSWVESANAPGCDFPIQNLPLGVYKRRNSSEKPRGGVAIGDRILDLAALGEKTGPTLNGLAAAGRSKLKALRGELSETLSEKKYAKKLSKFLTPIRQAELFIPVAIGDYSDFFTSLFHATNAGRMFRPDNPLLPNYKWVPIGYHGRASSVVVSGTPVVRPKGQLKPPDAAAPSFAASKRVDYEAELGFIVGPGNLLGKPIPLKKSLDHIFGVVLLNDWSARDIQAWEYQPLGPFLGKSYATTISPWIVTLEALAPFRVPTFKRPEGDPAPLPYLLDKENEASGHFDIQVEMWLRTSKMRNPHRLSRASYATSYWTAAQIVTHHASNGCNLRPGDLLGSGTISGPTADSVGSMLELAQGGKNPVPLPSGESRSFIEDGDEVILRGHCERHGFARIGFGEASGKILAA